MHKSWYRYLAGQLLVFIALTLAGMEPANADACAQRGFGGHEREVLRAYVAYYGRPADAGGLAFWSAELSRANGDLSIIIEPFGVSAEFNDRYSNLGDRSLIENLYRQLFGRDPDPGGLAFYTGELQAGRMSLQTIALNIIYGVQGDDVTIVANRLSASEYFVSCLEQGRFGYPAIPVAVSLLGTVTSSADSLVQARLEIDALINGEGNQRPYAGSLSLVADEGIVYVDMPLIGHDPDNDLIGFNLLSGSTGTGYADAYIGSQSGRLYLTLDGSRATAELSYIVSDGQLYSDPATVTIRVAPPPDQRGLGAETVDAQTYASFDIVRPWGNLLGAPGSEPTIPRRVDLSASFPTPGDQGSQGSCVGWATAYAIKSYFEKRDIGWDLSRQDHLFSPAFVFNAIALPGCQGSRPNDALDRLRDVGAATWDRMPYTDQSCSRQPSQEAMAQAGTYRIQSWGTLRTVGDIKAQLANHRPVLLGIMVYPSFNNLNGPDSVYNDFSGQQGGGHALAVVGYDDDRYGGALKVINSWSTSWGDSGFCWLPYNVVSNSQVFLGAYSLEDITNTEPPVDPVDPPPPPSGDLPNLEIKTWSADYSPRPGGSGMLRFEIANTGNAVAHAGAYVNLMLSVDERMSSDDVFVIYEPIPFDLLPGEVAYRDDNNALSFFFPDTLQPGTYLMAVWVDDLDSVAESEEGDNVSFGDPVRIENSLPDLVVNSWYADWYFGTGTLIYEVVNQGAGVAPGGWDVNLMLSPDYVLGDVEDIYLAYETTPWDLATGESVYRDWADPLYFDVSQVPMGVYYMALWVDDQQQVAESNERNNESWGWEPVFFGFGSGLLGATPDAEQETPGEAPFGPTRQYNGRRLPDDAQVYRVQILSAADGSRELKVLESIAGPRRGSTELLPTKRNAAVNPRLFPLERAHPMPAGR
jgi:hypothetical protein